MTSSQALKQIVLALKPSLQNLGFLLAGDTGKFAREADSAMHIIHFGGRLLESHSYMFGYFAAIRYPDLAPYVSAEHSDDPYYPTLTWPHHLLHEDREYVEWELEDGFEKYFLWDDVIQDIERYALPLFEGLPDSSFLEKELEHNDWTTRTTLNREQRAKILATISANNGDIRKAEEIMQHVIENNSHPARKRRMKKFIDLLKTNKKEA